MLVLPERSSARWRTATGIPATSGDRGRPAGRRQNAFSTGGITPLEIRFHFRSSQKPSSGSICENCVSRRHFVIADRIGRLHARKSAVHSQRANTLRSARAPRENPALRNDEKDIFTIRRFHAPGKAIARAAHNSARARARENVITRDMCFLSSRLSTTGRQVQLGN